MFGLPPYLVGMNDLDHADVRRIVYSSVAVRRDDLPAILTQSRSNNGLNGISGILYADGRRYLQVIEGTPEAVAHVFARIRSDPRHADVRVLSDERSGERIFGDWTMASVPEEGGDLVRARLAGLLRNAPDDVRALFPLAA